MKPITGIGKRLVAVPARHMPQIMTSVINDTRSGYGDAATRLSPCSCLTDGVNCLHRRQAFVIHIPHFAFKNYASVCNSFPISLAQHHDLSNEGHLGAASVLEVLAELSVDTRTFGILELVRTFDDSKARNLLAPASRR